MKKIFLIIGAPGSGKTSTAEKINNPNLSHYSVGGMYRAISENDSELGRTIKTYINQGQIVPDELAQPVLINFLEEGKDLIIIDGFPRTIDQAIMFDELISNNFSLIKVIEVIVSQDIALKRILGRKRGEDDAESLFTERMNIFNKDIKEIRQYYNRRGLYTSINGDSSIDIVVDELKSIILQKT